MPTNTLDITRTKEILLELTENWEYTSRLNTAYDGQRPHSSFVRNINLSDTAKQAKIVVTPAVEEPEDPALTAFNQELVEIESQFTELLSLLKTGEAIDKPIVVDRKKISVWQRLVHSSFEDEEMLSSLMGNGCGGIDDVALLEKLWRVS